MTLEQGEDGHDRDRMMAEAGDQLRTSAAELRDLAKGYGDPIMKGLDTSVADIEDVRADQKERLAGAAHDLTNLNIVISKDDIEALERLVAELVAKYK